MGTTAIIEPLGALLRLTTYEPIRVVGAEAALAFRIDFLKFALSMAHPLFAEGGPDVVTRGFRRGGCRLNASVSRRSGLERRPVPAVLAALTDDRVLEGHVFDISVDCLRHGVCHFSAELLLAPDAGRRIERRCSLCFLDPDGWVCTCPIEAPTEAMKAVRFVLDAEGGSHAPPGLPS